uniref:Uncharacterized protein n=1 Tax=Glossina austeni TaxID=7395 RepID=A0A1A9VV10_GLOAU
MVAASSRYSYRIFTRINSWWRPGHAKRPLKLSKKRVEAAQLPQRTENVHTNEAMSEEINTTELCSVDGADLREWSRRGHRWTCEPIRLLSGTDFFNCIRTKINALPSKSRTTQGRENQDLMC